jgi:hypothetical protein
LQAHSPLSYFPWTNTELINEPAYLDDFCPQLDEPFDFSLDPKGHERQRVDSVTESLSLTTSTATNLECESVYCPPEFSYGYQDLLISGQPFPDSYTRQVESGLRTFPTCSWDTDCNPEDVSQQLMCSACSKTFSNLRALDKHTQSTSHKAWSCFEAGCGKSYARRDTFLRHRSQHSNNSHACLDCKRDGKKKSFKRKDHLSEHIRSCHPKGNDGARSVDWVAVSSLDMYTDESIRTNIDPAREPDKQTSRNEDPLQVPVVPKIATTPQKQAMRDLLNSLRAVLGDRHPNLMGALENLMSLGGSDMESVAKTVAHTLLAERHTSAPE